MAGDPDMGPGPVIVAPVRVSDIGGKREDGRPGGREMEELCCSARSFYTDTTRRVWVSDAEKIFREKILF